MVDSIVLMYGCACVGLPTLIGRPHIEAPFIFQRSGELSFKIRLFLTYRFNRQLGRLGNVKPDKGKALVFARHWVQIQIYHFYLAKGREGIAQLLLRDFVENRADKDLTHQAHYLLRLGRAIRYAA